LSQKDILENTNEDEEEKEHVINEVIKEMEEYGEIDDID
jgi:hypothetical protein